MTDLAPSISETLKNLLGSQAAVPDKDLAGYAVEGLIPKAAVRPASRSEVAHTLAWAFSQNVTVSPRGGGTLLSLGNTPTTIDLVVELRKLDQILDFQPADLTVTVEAGIHLKNLQETLGQGGMFLPLESPLAQEATVGGILSTGVSGPRRFSYGLPRDWLIGISAISADGTETKAGGKVVKNVTGYDLNRLYTGSLGTLGVIVEASFKLAPLPTHFQVLIAAFDSISAAVEASELLLNQPYSPKGVQALNPTASRRLNLGVPEVHGAFVVAFFEASSAPLVERRVRECSRLLGDSKDADASTLTGLQYTSILNQITDLGWTESSTPSLAMKINVPPSRVESLVEKICSESAPGGGGENGRPGVIADIGFGTIRLFWWPEQDSKAPDEPQEHMTLATIREVRELASAAGGSAVVERCSQTIKQQIDVWGEPPQSIEIMRRIKDKFDPSGILNPGRFVGRL